METAVSPHLTNKLFLKIIGQVFKHLKYKGIYELITKNTTMIKGVSNLRKTIVLVTCDTSMLRLLPSHHDFHAFILKIKNPHCFFLGCSSVQNGKFEPSGTSSGHLRCTTLPIHTPFWFSIRHMPSMPFHKQPYGQHTKWLLQ